jgi:hypothetical protein
MINGFTNETKPLSEYERDTLTPIIVRGLSMKIGKERAIKNSEICAKMRMAGYKIDNARLRKVINHIRVNALLPGVIATSEGYYIATTKEEMADYIASLESRESAIHEVSVALRKQMALYE